MKRKRNAATIFRLTVLGCMLFLTGCASAVPVKIMPYVGVSTYPPTDPASVMVLESNPLRPHKTLGHVIVEPEGKLSIDETEKILRHAAASMGAHAVVVMANMAMQAGADRMQISGGHLITAVAIRYRDESAGSLLDERSD